MKNVTQTKCRYEQLYAIVSSGNGTKILRIARRLGALGGTIQLCKGTAGGDLLRYLGLIESSKEIVQIIAGKAIIRSVLKVLKEELHLDKPNHGIAFSTTVTAIAGSRNCQSQEEIQDEEERSMFHAITTIVPKGNAEIVIDAAVKAGAKGGTIINARGSGVHETKKLFNMEIEPEKEVVLIIVSADMTDAIVEAIRKDARLDEPGMGILFIQDVNCVYGMMQ